MEAERHICRTLGRQQDSNITLNTYCAWCRAPSQPGVTPLTSAHPALADFLGDAVVAKRATDKISHSWVPAGLWQRSLGSRDEIPVDAFPSATHIQVQRFPIQLNAD